MQLQQEHALMDRPLTNIDLRLPDRLVVRPRVETAAAKPGAATALPPPPPPAPPAVIPTVAKRPT